MMWYGVLGTKELLHRTYRNLEQKVLLEVRWPLPDLVPPTLSPLDALTLALFSLSAMGGPSPCPASRASQSSTFPATPEGPTSGVAPKKMMYVDAQGGGGGGPCRCGG